MKYLHEGVSTSKIFLTGSSNLQIFKSSNLQFFKSSNLQIFKTSNLQIFEDLRFTFIRPVKIFIRPADFKNCSSRQRMGSIDIPKIDSKVWDLKCLQKDRFSLSSTLNKQRFTEIKIGIVGYWATSISTVRTTVL